MPDLSASISDTPDRETHEYVFNHTMLRIKDVKKSLDFYTRIFGMKLVSDYHFEQWEFSVYFLQARGHSRDHISGPEETFGRAGLLELNHQWGSEDDPDFKPHSGNDPPTGFGHICIAVPDIEAACRRFADLGVTFQKQFGEGNAREIAFVIDPDGYWIEIVQPDLMPGLITRVTGTPS